MGFLSCLSGHIGRTFTNKPEPVEMNDPFSVNASVVSKPPQKILGINPTAPKYAFSKWCYDTPGTVQPDQVIPARHGFTMLKASLFEKLTIYRL